MMNNFYLKSWFPDSEGWKMDQVTLGESNARVWKIRSLSGEIFYLKRMVDRQESWKIVKAHELFSSFGLAPTVRWIRETPDASWVLTEAAPGVPAFEVDVPIGSVLGHFLNMLHQLPSDTMGRSLPTSADLFASAGLSQTEAMNFLKKYPEEKVVSHGDCCLPNLIIDSDRSVQMIDLGGAGLYDRYRDIERILWSFDYNGLATQKTAFLEAYGIPVPDIEKLNAYRSLGI